MIDVRTIAFAALLTACAPTLDASAPEPETPHRPIVWQAYEDATFDLARREDKLVIVDVGIEGCTACRWMYQDTYGNPAVARRMHDSFVAVSVDADVQPDLGARYERWGWPATIVLTPDGERVLALRGSRSPEQFLRILDDLVRRKKKGTLGESEDESHTISAAPTPSRAALQSACVQITGALDRDMNLEHGGWTDEGPQYIQGPAIEEAFLRAHVEGRPELLQHALKTLDGYARMIDPVWGGVYVAAHEVDFSGAIVEKRLVQEAEALRSFAAAYAATGDAKWRDRMGEIDRYVEAFLLAPDGTFYSTQQDDAPELPANMSSGEYFALPDAERRKYGVPPVDHGVYTDQNAQAIEAYAKAYEATGDARMRERATRAASAILATRLEPAGFVTQAAPSAALAEDDRKRAFRPVVVPYLTTHAHFVWALVALYRVTGEARWLDAARGIMGATREALEDRDRGGFFASPSGHRDKPRYENLVAARALHALAVYTHDEALDQAAERTLQSVAAPAGATFALAVQDLAFEPIELSIVGEPTDPRALALHAAALKVYEPRKAVQYDRAGRYPRRDRPALFACTRSACSSPVHDPAGVAAAVTSVAEALPASSCSGILGGHG